MINKQQYAVVLAAADVNRISNPEWRRGQAVFNVLYKLHPEVADSIRGTEHDMYHNDENIEQFKELITKIN